MDRRKFLSRLIVGAAGATTGMGLAKVGLGHAKAIAKTKESRVVDYKVQGFTCITCATGLEVMLLQQKGVTQANASYPEARVVIGFDEELTSEDAIRQFVSNCGFSVA
jgi:anaerobic selenocysteine-containing dehydrogenase